MVGNTYRSSFITKGNGYPFRVNSLQRMVNRLIGPSNRYRKANEESQEVIPNNFSFFLFIFDKIKSQANKVINAYLLIIS